MKKMILSSVGFLGLGFVANCCELSIQCASNRLETWEGEYAFYDSVSLETNGLWVARYKNIQNEGDLVEIYSIQTNGIERVVDAMTEVKGSTPIVLQIGMVTNRPYEGLWMLWRYPGNGGFKRYDEYARTNDMYRIVGQYEFIDVGNGLQWCIEDEDGEFVPMTNATLVTTSVLWSNTNAVHYGITPQTANVEL